MLRINVLGLLLTAGLLVITLVWRLLLRLSL